MSTPNGRMVRDCNGDRYRGALCKEFPMPAESVLGRFSAVDFFGVLPSGV